MTKQFTILSILIIAVFGCFALTGQVNAETEVSGNINTDTVWTLANSPYVIINNLTISEGVKLNIDPGVTVKFDGLYRLSVRGSLVACGTKSNFITFTSNKENPTPEDWDGIHIDQLSRYNILDYTKIEYSRGAIVFPTVTNQNNIISNSFIINNTIGIAYCGSNSEISYNTIKNVDTQISISGSCNIHHNNIIGENRGYLIGVNGYDIKINYNNLSIINNLMWMVNLNTGNNLDARNNWWGTTDTQFISDHIWDYEDNSIMGKVNYEPYALAKLRFDGTDTFSQLPICTSWTYSDWLSCSSNGQQTRNIIFSSPENCIDGNPILSQTCQAEIEANNTDVVDSSDQTTENNNTDNSSNQNNSNSQNVIQEEKNLITKIDKNLSKRVSGNILLQVEKNGEGWYVYPDDQKKYYLGRPTDAFSIMRNLGLGITHSELNNYLNAKFPSRLSGKIMLDVEQNGEAYYINPNDLKGYYLNRPSDAFRIMRELGLGITNDDVRKIDVGEIE